MTSNDMAMDRAISMSSTGLVIAASIIALVLYTIGGAIYELYFSPLAKFPGPKLAALTKWYNGYYDVALRGQYIWKVQEMHRKYGPVVRIRPDLLHVSDPQIMEKLYVQNPKQRRYRHDTLIGMVSLPESHLGTKDHDLHRLRRSLLSPYFSMQNVRRLEPVTNHQISMLLRLMEGWAIEGRPMSMLPIFRALAMDIIQSYAFGPQMDTFLDKKDCNAQWFAGVESSGSSWIGAFMPILLRTMVRLPTSITARLDKRVATIAAYATGVVAVIEEIRQAKELPEGKTIFHEILRSNLPDSEKTNDRLVQEAMVLILAGFETTASTMCALIFEVLSRPAVLAKMKAELETVMPDPHHLPKASKLEGLPYLNAVILEIIRLYPGGTHRQDRVAPDEDLVLNTSDGRTYVIPAGVGVGTDATTMNRHPDLYDKPDEFMPERYIENPKLQRHLFSFSKGLRQCLGINLAMQNAQIITAAIFRRYDLYDPTKKEQSGPTMELYETTAKEMRLHGDLLVPVAYPGSPGLRVIFRR